MTTSDDHGDGRGEVARDGLEASALEDLVALGQVLELRVRRGTATLDDFGVLARTRRELARREEAAASARARGGSEPV